MKRTHVGLTLALTLSLGLIVAFLLLAGSTASPALAQAGSGTVRVARTHPEAQDILTCGSVTTPCETIQYAVDLAQPDDDVLVAVGVYSDINGYASKSQVVYISKTLDLQGGYTYTNWAMSDPDLYRTIIDAEGQGRGVMITGPATITIEGFEITGGNATGLQGFVIPEYDCGGGVYAAQTNLTLTNCQIYDNLAAQDKGGRGGGVYAVQDLDNSVTIHGCDIYSNTASTSSLPPPNGFQGSGGGLEFRFGTVTVEASRITSNTGSEADEGYGGGLSSNARVLTLRGNLFRSNTASSAASGYGGGLYLNASGDNTVIATDNEITSNTASANHNGRGGGLWLSELDITLEGNKFLGNVAATLVLSEGIGGGLYVRDQVEMTMTNNLVANNWGPTRADGMWFDGDDTSASTGYLIHNTFADNGAPGGIGEGILIEGDSKLVMTNTIISGHAEAGVEADESAEADLEATLWFGNGADIAGTGAVTTGTIDLHGDPAYADPANWDYHLSQGSAAIDQGIDAGVYDDLDGLTRPALGGFDIGAYEFPYAVALAPDRTGEGEPGDLVTYTHTLTNEGDVTDTFALSHASDQGWEVTCASPVTLAAGQTQTLVVSVQVAADALSGTVDTTVVTATSQGGPSVMAAVKDETTALLAVGVGLTPDQVATAAPGKTVIYTHTLSNTGNWTDTLTLEASSSQGWAVADAGPYTLAAGGEQPVVVTVIVPVAATDGAVDTTVLTATSAADAMEYALVTDTTTVKLATFDVYLPVVLKNH